jgi:hypothetical protein
VETAIAYDLFLSYSRRDLAAAETLAARLVHETGLRLWMDRARLQPGASWREEEMRQRKEGGARRPGGPR